MNRSVPLGPLGHPRLSFQGATIDDRAQPDTRAPHHDATLDVELSDGPTSDARTALRDDERITFSSNALRTQSRFPPRWILLSAIALISCKPGTQDSPNSRAEPPTASLSHSLVDADGDGMDDSWETSFFGDLTRPAAGDFDSDGMTNLEEYSFHFNPTVKDALDDSDGDRYPNIFEIRKGSDPNDAASVPTPEHDERRFAPHVLVVGLANKARPAA